MALAGAPRLILFDEPAAGLSPAERRELVALLTSLPAHMSFVLIEHDLDIALKVVERVTVMHNGRVLKTGSPSEIENDAQVQAIYMGGLSLLAGCDAIVTMARRKRGPMLVVDGLDVYYGRAPRAAGRRFHDRARRARHRRPQRHGQDHAVQRDHRPRQRHRQRQAGRRRDSRPGPARDHAARHRLCAARPARLAVAVGGRDAAPGGQAQARSRPHLRDVPAPGRTQGPRRRDVVGWRATDAGHRPRAAAGTAPAGDGRAHRGPGTGHRRAGGAGAARAGGTARSACC